MRHAVPFGFPILVVAMALAASEYDPARDPAVNPPTLRQPLPTDPGLVADHEGLIRRLPAEPQSLNPLLMGPMHELWVKELLFDEPVVCSARWEWVLNTAMTDSFAESDDHRSAVLRLRPGLTWHDGRPLTADDIVFSWRVITDDRVPALQLRATVQPIADCKAIDSTAVRYEFKEALPTNRWGIQFPVIPRHVYEPVLREDPSMNQSGSATRANRNPVGNGPYRLAEWKGGERIVLERWKEYSGVKPHFARILFRVVPDSNVALLMFKAGDLDELAVTPQQFASLATDQSFARVGLKGWAPQATVYCIAWNGDGSNPFFADPSVRRAMSYALNLPLVLSRVYDNLSLPGTSLFPPPSWAHNPDVQPRAYDADQAGQLLDGAGWRIDAVDGWRHKTVRQPDGVEARTRLAFKLSYAQESKTAPQVGAILQQDLKRLGVEMTLEGLEYATLRQRVFRHEFEAVFWAWTATPEPDDARHLLHSDARRTGENFVGYSNPKVDELFDRARRSFEPEDRIACYRQIAQIVQDDAPYTFVTNAATLWVFHRRLRGVEFSPFGPFGFSPGLRGWWVPRDEVLRGGSGG